jgi:hypothetical protein
MMPSTCGDQGIYWAQPCGVAQDESFIEGHGLLDLGPDRDWPFTDPRLGELRRGLLKIVTLARRAKAA